MFTAEQIQEGRRLKKLFGELERKALWELGVRGVVRRATRVYIGRVSAACRIDRTRIVAKLKKKFGKVSFRFSMFQACASKSVRIVTTGDVY